MRRSPVVRSDAGGAGAAGALGHLGRPADEQRSGARRRLPGLPASRPQQTGNRAAGVQQDRKCDHRHAVEPAGTHAAGDTQHTHTHTHVCFCELWGLSIGVMSIYLSTPKPNPLQETFCIFTFSKKLILYDL